MSDGPIDEKAIFNTARKIADVQARESYLSLACGDDADAMQRVRDLIHISRHADSFLESPPPGIEATEIRPLTEQPGDVIGPYKLLQQIGEGGMGVVYLAEQTEPVERRVALKIIKPGMDTQQVIARFEAERQALAMMDHPNIAKVLDAGTTDTGRPYFVMELVKGMPVTQFCDEQHMTPKERLELFVPICQAVQHAHQKGVIHRDLKPSNILVAQYDNKAVPKVIDFGVAKAISQKLTEKTMFTQYGQIVGTLEYMSPEQARFNQLDVDTRSDIYSLGVLLYELLTGETPFDKKRLRSAAFDELLRIIREEEPPKPSTKLSSSELLANTAVNRKTEPKKLSLLVRGDLDWIVMKALEKDRTRRYETANAFAADVLRYLSDEPVTACPPSAVYKFRKFARRNKAGLTMTAVIGLAVLVVVGSLGWMVRDRAARQAMVAGQVELIVSEVERLEDEQKWPEALAAAKRAKAVLDSGSEVPEELNARTRQALADLLMVARLEEIRLLQDALWRDQRQPDFEGGNRRYTEAFQQFGLDVDAVSTTQAVEWLHSRARVLSELVVGLDGWANCRRQLKDEAGATRLTELAQMVDADRWRRRVREALLANNGKALEELAVSEDVVRQPPTTIFTLALALKFQDNPDHPGPNAAADLLLRVYDRYPGDFFLNFELAYNLTVCRPPRTEEAVGYYRAALALRPANTMVLHNLGAALSDQGKIDEAIACYHKAIKLKPSEAIAYTGLGAALSDQGKIDEAIDCYRKAIELDASNAAAYNNLGNALQNQEKLDEAIACYNKAIELNPKYAEPHCNLGAALKKQGKIDQAIGCYRKAIELYPEYTNAYSHLAQALRDQGMLDEAIGCYRKIIELDPQFADAYNNLGAIQCDVRHDYEAAAAMFQKAVELQPKIATFYFNLGNVLRHQGKLDEAIACYRKAIKLDTRSAEAHTNLGIAFRDLGKLDEAVASFRKAIEVNAEFAQAYGALGEVLLIQGKNDEAIPFCHKAIELDPQDVTSINNLGVAQRDLGQLDEAVVSFRKAIEVDPEYALAYSNLGGVLLKQNETEEAVASYRKAIELDPQVSDNHNQLGIILCDVQRDYEAAAAAFRSAIALEPGRAAFHFNLGNALTNQGKLDEAIASYRKAVELDPKHVNAYFGLGNTLAASGQLDAAIACYRKTIELEPKYATAWANLGYAQYLSEQYLEAVASLATAKELAGAQFSTSRSYILVMAYWRTGNQEAARKSYAEAVVRDNKPSPERTEAEKLLGIGKPQLKSNPDDMKPDKLVPPDGASE